MAILDHNNLGRQQVVTADGVPRFEAVFLKRTQEWVAKPIYASKTHAWRHQLLRETVKFQLGKRTALQIEVPKNVPNNIAHTPRPDKGDIVDRHVYRFTTRNLQESSSSDEFDNDL